MPFRMWNNLLSKGACDYEKKKDNGFAHRIDFKEQTPEIQLNEVKPDPLYKKAFLSREDKNTSEYARNTATWD